MTMAGTTPGKLHPVAKWSLIIGPVLIVVFNFLMPVNGFSPIDPEDTGAYITALGADADIAQVYILIILLGVVLFTRGIIGLWQATPTGSVARQRLTVGLLGTVAALGLWGVVLGLGLAEASVAKNVVDATAAAGAGVAGMAEKAASATLIATTLHAGYFGVFQVTTFVAFIALIPLGGGIAVSGIVRKEFGWLIIAIGVVTVIVTSVMPVKTEAGSMAFGIIALVWGLTWVVMGLQIMRQDMNGSAASASTASDE
ncbi:MAG: hypothetical protein J4N97_08680 [Chloroflexi bacterium]|nr:hypothetical protein [Chloroflexota bacterium]